MLQQPNQSRRALQIIAHYSVPQGRLTLAQHEVLGLPQSNRPVPKGTTERVAYQTLG